MKLKIVLYLLFVKACSNYAPVSAKNLNTANRDFRPNNENKSISNLKLDIQKKTPGFRIRLPFLDMEIQNKRNLLIMQESCQKTEIFLLHGSELYQMFIDRNEKRLSLVGYLGGSLRDDEPLSGEVITWHRFHVIVIAIDDYLEVYQLPSSLLETRAKITKDPKRMNETAPTFEPIQQISLPGGYRQHFLTDPDKENILLIVGVNFTKLYGRLHTFLWSNTYFEPIEELTVPPLHMLQILGTHTKYLIRGRIIQHQTKTIITVYKIQSPAMTLYTTQTITANSRIVHATSFHSKNYLIACSIQQKQCNSFRMNSEGLFNVYKQRSSQDLAFDKVVGGKHFLIAARRNQVLVYRNGRMDCYGSFVTNETDVTSIQTLLNSHGESFILLNYKRPFYTLVRFVEIESETVDMLGSSGLNATETEDFSTLFRHRHMFEETIGMLRSLLLRRRNIMNTFRHIPSKPKTQSLELQVPVRIHGGNINIIKIMDQRLVSPLQLLKRIAGMRQKFGLRREKRESKNSTLSSRLKVKSLKVMNLVYVGSILEGFHWDKLAQPMPILSVRPKLTTKILNAKKLMMKQEFKHTRLDEALSNKTQPVMKFKELNVESINEISWQEFYDSVFLKNRDTTIKGNLILQATTNITDLTTQILNKLNVKNLFNLEQPQIVNSNIEFSGFLIKELRAETINGLDFANDIVFQNSDDLIETPVNMYKLSIVKDLLLDDNVTVVRNQIDDENDFEQHYTGRVVINGSLTIKNLGTEKAARILINGMQFSKSYIEHKFLLRNQSQNFNSKVQFGNAKVSVPNLNTNFLNDNPTEEHLRANDPAQSLPITQPLLLVFVNARIEGDLESKNFPTRIANVSRNAVRQGNVANITGVKTFKAPLTIDHLMTLSLNQLLVSDLVLKSQLKRGFKFEGIKSFNNVLVNGYANVHKSLNVSNLNKLPTNELFNYDFHIERMRVPFRLEAKNIVFQKINDICFDEVFSNFKLRDGELVLHKELIIDGNVRFSKDLFVKNINDINWRSYEDDLVLRNDNAIITGRKCFLEELTITNVLKTPMLNELNMEKIFSKILSKSRAQILEGTYTFGNLKLSNLDVDIVNNIPTTEFIDLRSQKIIIDGDLIVPKVTVHGSVNTIDVLEWLDLQFLTKKISQLPNLFWRNIVVLGNAFCHQNEGIGKTQHELLNYLYRYAVQRYGQQVITGNVRLMRPLITKMKTKGIFSKEIDFDFLAKDCVFRNTKKMQIISAEKIFLLPVHVQDIETKSYLDVPLINGIDAFQLNSSLYYLSSNEPIIGPLHFITTPKFSRLMIEGLINGIDPSMIYYNASQIVPPIHMRRLIVEGSLEICDINDNSLDDLLTQRITKQSREALEISGTLNFENLVLNEKVFLQSINDIPIDKLVFKKSNQLQAITGAKIIEHNVILAGPVHVMRLNDEDLIESYQQSIFINRNYHYNKLRINGATFEKGLIFTNPVGPMLTSTMEATENSELSQRRKIVEIETELHEIDQILDDKSQIAKDLLYLDYTPNWHILWQTPPSNISFFKSFTFELKKSNLCERQYLNVQISQTKSSKSGIIFLSNFTTNLITNSLKNIKVKAENYCNHKYRKVKSKITITGLNFTKMIGMKKYIEQIITYSPDNQSTILLLLHAIDLSRNQNEVRILKITNSKDYIITDWQSLTLGIGKTLRLFEHTNYTTLISGSGILKNHPALAIYHFDFQTQKFMLVQIIDGEFDIHELLPINPRSDFQLILSCRQCQRVHVYMYRPRRAKKPYQIFQILKLKTLIDRVQTFKVGDGSCYLLFLAENGQHYYHLYRFSSLHGWLHITYGYFENTEMALPLTSNALELDQPYLLALLCGVNNCSLLRAVLV